MSVCVQRPIEGHRAPGNNYHKIYDAYSPVSPMCFAKSTLGELNRKGTGNPVAGPFVPTSISSTTEHNGHGGCEHGEQSPDTLQRSGNLVPQAVPAVKAMAAPQSLPCSRNALAASLTPYAVLSTSASAVPTPLECSSTPNACTQPKPSVARFPAVPEVLMPQPWGPLPRVAEDTAALPCQDPALLLHERASEESNVNVKKRRRHGVLSLLKDVCKSLMGSRTVAPMPAAEMPAVPVSRLEDDTPLVAWRQDNYVQSLLQHSPQLTVGEAKAEFLRRSFEQNIRLIGSSALSSSGGVSPSQQEAFGAPCVPDELLSELSAEEDVLPCHPLQDLDAALDEAWFFGSFSTPAPSYAGSCCSSWHG